MVKSYDDAGNIHTRHGVSSLYLYWVLSIEVLYRYTKQCGVGKLQGMMLIIQIDKSKLGQLCNNMGAEYSQSNTHGCLLNNRVLCR